MSNERRFTHPAHARPIQAIRYDRGLDNGPLTDSKIRKYALEGYYGPEEQERERNRKLRKRSGTQRKAKSTSPRELKRLTEDFD